MTRRSIGFALAGMLLVPPGTALATPQSSARPVPPRTVTLNYYGPSVAGRPGLTWNGGYPPTAPLGDGGLGAVLVPLRASDVTAILTPTDASGQPVGASAYFYDGVNNTPTGFVTFCGKSLALKVPARAASLRVSLDPTICPGLVTKGTVTATLVQRQPKHH